MTGPIAAILAVMIGVGSALGGADLSAIKERAERQQEEQVKMEQASKYLIAIDAGHQEHGNFGQEPIGPGASQTKNKVAGGTRGTTTGVPEYQLTLDVSLKLRDILEEKGYEVLMIRETNDVDITNAERAELANDKGADVFVRIHANGSTSSSANGAMTICQTSSNPYNSEYYKDSYRLSELVLDAYTEATGIRKERIWETDTMTGINWCTVPVTIIELGYMTNPEEDTKMQDPEFQQLMAEGLANGIEAYVNEKMEAEPVTDESLEYLEEEPVTIQNDGNPIKEEETDDDDDSFDEEDEETEEERLEREEREAQEAEQLKAEQEAREAAQKLRDVLYASSSAPACKTAYSANGLKRALDASAREVISRYDDERLAATEAQMKELEEKLREEIEGLGGQWSLYLKRLDTDQKISINGDQKMVAASLIKLFIAGELFHEGEEGVLDPDDHGKTMFSMINVSDNGCANTLINLLGMDNVNEFCQKNGYKETELNRRMLEYNGMENYTSARDCGKMLEEVLEGTYVSSYASEKILEALKAQAKTGKIPAGVPQGVQTANKTGELSYVDNDAAIVWSPSCTYVLCIMSSNAGNRIYEIKKLSSMVYEGLNPQPEESAD